MQIYNKKSKHIQRNFIIKSLFFFIPFISLLLFYYANPNNIITNFPSRPDIPNIHPINSDETNYPHKNNKDVTISLDKETYSKNEVINIIITNKTEKDVFYDQNPCSEPVNFLNLKTQKSVTLQKGLMNQPCITVELQIGQIKSGQQIKLQLNSQNYLLNDVDNYYITFKYAYEHYSDRFKVKPPILRTSSSLIQYKN